MKLAKKNKKTSVYEIGKEYIKTTEEIVTCVYLFCMLGIFPLYYKEQYYKIGDAKFNFFLNSALYYLGGMLLLMSIKAVFRMISDRKGICSCFCKKEILQEKENKWEKFFNGISALDFAVLVYGICVVLSYLFSNYKEYAYKGASGWEMGFRSQKIFVILYFILSRQQMFEKAILFGNVKTKSLKIRWTAIGTLGIHLIASALAFLFGIIHRFDIDPLGMYEGLELHYKVEFLSTIGQATWFSSYVCTVFAIGVTVFYISKNIGIRTATGIYTVISFGILVTQNSDSAFIAIAGIMLLLGYYSLGNIKKWCRFWQISCIMWGTFAGIGVLQRIFAERTIPLDSLSVFFSQSKLTKAIFIFSLGIFLFYERKKGHALKREKQLYKVILYFLTAAVVFILMFIYLNTKGYLLSWFGYQSTHQYLLFDYHWGSNRGSTWIVCWQAFLNLPWYQKLFGVGPDSLSQYLYSVPEISDFLKSLWGNVRLTNAHNEYLNSLICYGMVGLVSWLAVLIGGIFYFYDKAKENSFMIAFALCIAGYACHNIFCYQQVCCTPFLFIILGIGESLTKSQNFNTIK